MTMANPSDEHSEPTFSPDACARQSTDIIAYNDGALRAGFDVLAVERPLEIHIAGASPLVTMRTPGHDRELAAGLLYSEGVVQSAEDIVYLNYVDGEPDVIRVMLRPEARTRLERIERSTLVTSACGVCGKPSFCPPTPTSTTQQSVDVPRIAPGWLLALPEQLRASQDVFESTGGLHAAALFAAGGELLMLREDVGRHNALDKLVGRALLDDRLPLVNTAIMLSGRASYELLQKSVFAGVPIVCAISAPSSFAVEMAVRFSVTLVGFIRGHRFNVYAGADRLTEDSNS